MWSIACNKSQNLELKIISVELAAKEIRDILEIYFINITLKYVKLMHYLVPKHLFANIELENLLPRDIYKPYRIDNPTNLHREVECHKLNDRLKTMVSSTNSNASKTSLLDMQGKQVVVSQQPSPKKRNKKTDSALIN